MTAAANRHWPHPLGRTLRQIQTSTGYGNSRALMHADPVPSCKVYSSDILRPDDEELPRPGLGPCLFPFLARREAILLPMKLGMEEPLRAEAQVYLASLLLPFQSLQTLLQSRRPPPLVMQLLRTRQAFGQLAYDSLSLADFRLQVLDA